MWMSPVTGRLEVQFYGPIPGFMGNLLWRPRWPMRGGRYPAGHPCSGNPEPTTFDTPAPTDDPLGRFRGLGYHASCFPEGDGVAFRAPAGKSTAQMCADIVACFNFRLTVRRDAET